MVDKELKEAEIDCAVPSVGAVQWALGAFFGWRDQGFLLRGRCRLREQSPDDGVFTVAAL